MATRVNSDYINATELKILVGIHDSGDDDRVSAAITAASRAVDATCGRPTVGGARGGFWYISAATATFRPEEGYDPALIGDWAAIGTVSTSDDGGTTWSTLASTNWQGEPLNADTMGEVFTHLRRFDAPWPSATSYPGRPCLRIVGTLGWSAVPDEVKQATRLQAVRWFKRPDAPFGVTGGELGPMFVRKVDPDVAAILSRLVWPVFG